MSYRVRDIGRLVVTGSLRFWVRHASSFVGRLRRRQGPWLIVFAYHGVTERSEVANSSYGIQILKGDFERHCQILASLFRPSHVDEFFERESSESGDVHVLLSFDDVYQSVATTAVPVLERYGLKFMLFPASDYVDRTDLFWWDRVRLTFRATASSSIHIEGRSFDVKTAGTREKSMLACVRYLATMNRQGREERVARIYNDNLTFIRSKYGDQMDELRPVTRASLEKLKDNPLCRMGVHSASHCELSRLSQDDLENELRTSKDWYEEVFKTAPQDFCYPFGRTDRRVDEACQRLGFRRGFALDPRRAARVRKSSDSGPSYRVINRYILHPDDDLESIRGKGAGMYDPFLRLLRSHWL